MNDITALAQRLRVYAEEFSYPVLSPDDCRSLVEALESGDTENERMARDLISRNGEIEGLRKRVEELEEVATDYGMKFQRAQDDLKKMVLMHRDESRTVTVKQGEVLVTVSGFTGCGKSAIAGEIEIAMKAIGVPVNWTNGDAEKRMTGADWLTSIEMYKPTVRIVEENISRAAGIQVIEGGER